MTFRFDPATFARREIRALASYNAGLSLEAVRARYGVEHIAKLGSNENPLGPSPKVVAAIADAASGVGLYPDAECSQLRERLAQRLGVAGERLVFGNGSEDLLAIIAGVFLDHGDEVVTVVPSFGLHILYPQAAGADVRTVILDPHHGFDVPALLAAVTPRTRLMMISSPSNPVGCALDEAQVRQLLEGLPAHVLLVFDEAYYEYACHTPGYPDCLALLEASARPWILLRTLSKAYALAGLRIGYGVVSHVELADVLDRLRNPFNVNRLAQAAALAALDDDAHLRQSLELVYRERALMAAVLQGMGVFPAPSLGNFLFFDTEHEADRVNEALLRRGVIIKPWREPGFTRWLRVSIGSSADNSKFLDALTATLAAL